MISYGSGRVSYLGSGRHCALYCSSCLFVRCWNWKCVRGKNTLPSTYVGGASKFLGANWCAKQKLCNMRTPSMFARNEGLDILIFAGEVERHRKPLFLRLQTRMLANVSICRYFAWSFRPTFFRVTRVFIRIHWQQVYFCHSHSHRQIWETVQCYQFPAIVCNSIFCAKKIFNMS